MTVVGTPLYMSPETLRHERYGQPADMFAFGGCLVNLATRRELYSSQQLPPFELIGLIAAGGILPTIDLAEGTAHRDERWPDELAEIAAKCVGPDAEERPTFASLVDQLVHLGRGAELQIIREASHRCSSSRTKKTGRLRNQIPPPPLPYHSLP